MYIIHANTYANDHAIINTDNFNSIWQKGSCITLSIPVIIKPGITEYPPFREDYLHFANKDNAEEAYHAIEDAICEGCRAIKLVEILSDAINNDGEPVLFAEKYQ